MDEFLDSVTVIPPGEWDPNIRIEPPTVIPSQQKRVEVIVLNTFTNYLFKNQIHNINQKNTKKSRKQSSLDKEDGHGQDPALKRTGKLFGGLIADIKRKLPYYKSDFTDGFNLQSIATFCFMYFALLAPIVTFGGLLEEATHQRMVIL